MRDSFAASPLKRIFSASAFQSLGGCSEWRCELTDDPTIADALIDWPHRVDDRRSVSSAVVAAAADDRYFLFSSQVCNNLFDHRSPSFLDSNYDQLGICVLFYAAIAAHALQREHRLSSRFAVRVALWFAGRVWRI